MTDPGFPSTQARLTSLPQELPTDLPGNAALTQARLTTEDKTNMPHRRVIAGPMRLTDQQYAVRPSAQNTPIYTLTGPSDRDHAAVHNGGSSLSGWCSARARRSLQ